jgi:predicted O-linked N-acetylglucosamine transferase (SPINDLY family)
LRELDDFSAAKRICDDKVDILVDLMGHTSGSRLTICAFRPAPIQVSYLGFLGTTGADFLDYIITDRIVTPEDQASFYSENFVYMPHCYMVTDHRQSIAVKEWNKADFGLPEDHFVFCSFNGPYKIEPLMFDLWMSILRELPRSVLWLREMSKEALSHLKEEAEDRGIQPERIIFAERLPSKEEHLARLRLVDLVLDTRIYNGHTTTSDSLWAGVPVITLEGHHFASRSATSLLTSLDLTDLITKTPEEYHALAIHLAQNPDELQALRQKLEENRLKAPLFDTPRFVKNLESAYKEIWKIFVAGEDPRLIEVKE